MTGRTNARWIRRPRRIDPRVMSTSCGDSPGPDCGLRSRLRRSGSADRLGAAPMLRVLLGIVSALAVAGGIWIVGCGLVRERTAAERLAAGICAWLAVAWICMAQPLLGISVVAHRWLAVILLVL